MKILVLNWRDMSHPKAGGAERVTQEHAKAWVKYGHSVTLFTSRHTNAKQSETVDDVRIVRYGGSVSVYVHAAKYLLTNSSKYDIIVDEIHGLPCFSFFVWSTPVIAFIHEVAGDIWDTMFFFPLNKIGKFLEPWLLRVYDFRKIPFWTDAPSTVAELKHLGILKSRAIAIPCPITNTIPQKWEEKEKNPTFLFVSRVVPMKGIESVIRAFSLIKEKESQAQLQIVGSGDESYVDSLKKMIERLNLSSSVLFCGKVSEEKKLQLMGKAHILLHASVKEGWGLVVLEAASQGTPSVVYNVAGLRDVVKDGSTGVVIKRNDSVELATEALALYKDKRRYNKYQEQGKKWVMSLDWKKVTQESLNLLKATVERKFL